jgi:hypothetical protein
VSHLPPALRDEMLRLMGGCEHTWRPAADAHTYECECGMTWQSADLTRQPLPAVGDGHAPTMEELFDVVERLGGYAEVRIFYGADGTYRGLAYVQIGGGSAGAYNRVLRIALATAIAEAMKEVPA